MNKQIERILICVLWLLAATLGTCFWLNTTFGFNIFSAQHWQYLAYLQAAQTPVQPAFYISFTCAILISLGVLYVLIRPRGVLRRRIGINRAHRVPNATPEITQSQTIEPTMDNNIHMTQPAPTHQTVQKLQRPPRIGLASGTTTQQPIQQTPASHQSSVPQHHTTHTNNTNFDELRDIFESNGYVVKHSPQIGNFKPALLAIGTNESLWMGGIGITESVLATTMERLATIFSDTLDDIQINIFGFIIAPNGAVSNTDIQTFTNTAQLRTYMESNKNIASTDAGDIENFNAYSEYIDTVINYMDKT